MSHFFRLQGIKVYWRLQFLEYLRTLSLKFQKAGSCLSLAETASWADSGQLQFWSQSSEILNKRSSSTPEPVAFTIPWCLEVWKILNHLMYIIEISIFLLNHVIIMPTKIMNNLLKDGKIRTFKVIFQHQKSMEAFWTFKDIFFWKLWFLKYFVF